VQEKKVNFWDIVNELLRTFIDDRWKIAVLLMIFLELMKMWESYGFFENKINISLLLRLLENFFIQLNYKKSKTSV
jgi:hypothetical protein